MKDSIILKELKSIYSNKKILIPIIAILVIPILYAGMFLWAFWDPYDYLSELPVAIVNEDEGTTFEGERLELGNELVDKLKEEPEFDFHFVDKDDGYQGLKDQEYYILIEIPKNFSENSTTVMDDKPEKIELIYKPNESYNFLASQIGETAMLHIEQALEEKVTESYAEAIFEKIEEVADGLEEASEATEELNDGAHELEDGSKKLKDNLEILASKTIEFTNGVETARSGSGELAKGSTKLADGMNQLNDGGGKLLDASKEVQNGSKQLADGISTANSGIKEMNGKMPELVNGTDQVKGGFTQFQNELPKQMAGKIGEQLEASSKAMNSGLDQLEDGIVGGVDEALTKELAPQLSNGLTTNLSEQIAKKQTETLQGMPENLSAGIAAQMAPELMNQQKTQVENMFAIMEEVGISPEQIGAVMQVVEQNQPSEEAIKNDLQQKLLQGISGQMPSTDDLQQQIKENIGPGIEEGVSGAIAQASSGIQEAVQGGFNEYKTELNKSLSGATSGLEDQIANAVNPAFNQLNDGLSAIHQGQLALQSGVSQLADGTDQLDNGANQLASGQSEFVMNMELFRGKLSEANNGSHELSSGANELADGMNKLKDGSEQLSDGSHQLADGSGELNEGMGKLVDGTEEFNEKMHEASDDAKDVNTTEDTHNMIANPLNVNNEKINKVPNYGTGFAPYFLSLGLFVGALLLSIVYPLRQPAKTPKNAFDWFSSKFVVLLLVGIFQAIIAGSVLLLALDLQVQSVPLFFLYAIITSLTFVTLIQFLVTCFGDPGRFVAIIILILQLTTSAGTFPLELIPNSLQFFNAFLPMTYTVQGFKAVISSGEFAIMWQNAAILIGFTLIFMVGALTYFLVMYKRNFAVLTKEEKTTA